MRILNIRLDPTSHKKEEAHQDAQSMIYLKNQPEEEEDSKPIRLTPISETTERKDNEEDKDASKSGSVFSEVVEEIIGG